MDIMTIAGWVVLGLGAVMALMGLVWVRQQIRRGDNVTYGTINSIFAFLVALVVVWFADYSPFHLLWLFPASFAMGVLTMVPIFSAVLVPLAKLYGHVACIGLNDEEVARNRARVERVRELIAGGMGKDEAVRLALSEDAASPSLVALNRGNTQKTHLLRFLDAGPKGVWANIRMDNNDPCWIGVADTGVLVKKSKVGTFGTKLYNEKIPKAASTAKSLHDRYSDDLTPPDMRHPLLKAFTNAVLHCSDLEGVKRVLNDNYPEAEFEELETYFRAEELAAYFRAEGRDGP